MTFTNTLLFITCQLRVLSFGGESGYDTHLARIRRVSSVYPLNPRRIHQIIVVSALARPQLKYLARTHPVPQSVLYLPSCLVTSPRSCFHWTLRPKNPLLKKSNSYCATPHTTSFELSSAHSHLPYYALLT